MTLMVVFQIYALDEDHVTFLVTEKAKVNFENAEMLRRESRLKGSLF